MDATLSAPRIDTDHFDELANLVDDMRRSLRLALDKALAAHGLNFMQRRLLIQVARQGGLSQSRLAKALGVERATIGLVVDALVDKGLVERSVVTGDRRSWAIVATGDGTRMLAKVQRITEDVCGRVFRGFSPDEFATLESFLLRMAGNAVWLREGEDRDDDDDGGGPNAA
jgi:DNA-binding MarR family transcriptional regulator